MKLATVYRYVQILFFRGAIVLILTLVFTAAPVFAQDAPAPLNSPSSSLLDELLLRGRAHRLVHSAIKPYHRGDVFDAALNDASSDFPVLNPHARRYLLGDNDLFYPISDSASTDLLSAPPQSDRTFLRIFYKRPAHFFAFDDSSFSLRINPVLHFHIGKESGNDDLLFINRRGAEVSGVIDRRVYFYTNILETQLRPAAYIREFVEDKRALPDAGLFKNFNGRLFPGEGAYDYLASNGAVGLHVSRHISLQLGHGKHFLGDGYRSLFLSDFAKNYFYLKFNTRVWKFHYQNLFAELGSREKLPGNTLVPKKYLAAHYLSFKVTPAFTVGLYEAVIFAREENRFELQYLNPIILYRSIEHHVGSPDNVLIGLSATWDVAQRARVYGQFILDEFVFNEFFSERNWWGNKYGVQLGVWYPDAFEVEDLDVRLEYNRVRPYTYTHYDSLGSYAHFNQALAHPLGANFTEVLLKLDYRPVPRLWVTAKAFAIRGGADTDSAFYGSDILRSNSERVSEFGVNHRQGVPIKNTILSLNVAYMLRHNFFLEAQYFQRDYDSDAPAESLLTRFVSLGVRWNYFPSQDEF